MQLKKIASFLKEHGRRAGFTMIELLVVIAILGILAATVLAAINPVEQINRARDTREQSDGAQLKTSVQRFYTSQQKWPWMVASATGVGYTPPGGLTIASAYTADTNAAGTFWWGLSMEDTGEIQSGFLERLTAQQAGGDIQYVWKIADTGGISQPINVCFVPRSYTYKQQALADCLAGKNPPSGGGVVPCPASPTINTVNMICGN